MSSSFHNNHYHSYSWHQSHDQATILLVVPRGTEEADIAVAIERNQLVAGVRGHEPIIKGRLYNSVNPSTSSWQLEPRPADAARSAAAASTGRERTISTASTTSTQSSYAFVSDLEITSSFAASLGGNSSAPVSDAEDSGLSSPVSLTSDPLHAAGHANGHGGTYPFYQRQRRGTLTQNNSIPSSPRLIPASMSSSFSSLEDLHSRHTGRLLTLHLDKVQSGIWPALIVGALESMDASIVDLQASETSEETERGQDEQKYDMDPTSLALLGLEYYDIRRSREEAFEYFIRAWRKAHLPSATIRLATHYLPVSTTGNIDYTITKPSPSHGTVEYYAYRMDGPEELAQLYLEAGLLHLEGAASGLRSPSYTTLESTRLPSAVPRHSHTDDEQGTAAWRRDREAASMYFTHARTLNPQLDVPLLPDENDGSGYPSPISVQLEMPSIDVQESSFREETRATIRRRREKEREKEEEELSRLLDERSASHHPKASEVDISWSAYLPGAIGAGTALLVVGVIGAMSLSTWRRNQSS